MKNLFEQLDKIETTFGDEIQVEISNKTVTQKDTCIPILIVPRNIIPTKDIFSKIDLGIPHHNSWFLDLEYMYDIVPTPNKPYVIHNVDHINSKIPPSRAYQIREPGRPLTLHEVVSLAFQYPELINTRAIFGIQAYGSRFTKNQLREPGKDDTLEIYRKGNPGEGFAKLAREQYRYEEDGKIIPLSY